MTELYFSKIWHYTLFNIGNNEMMVSNLVIALFMLWLGFRYYKTLTSKLHLYVAGYMEDDTSTALVLQRIVTYLIVFIYGVFVLDLANIPISTFAFLGGTVALSVGLGAQTLMGNFLSGLLVAMEKSLKIGDVVEIDGVVGVVQSIGIRSTIIRTFCDSYIVIPNSNFVHSIFARLKTHKNLVETKANIEIEMGNKSDAKVREDILDSMNSVDALSQNPKINIYLVEIRNKKYIYSIYFYSKITEQYNIEYVKNLINQAIAQRFGQYEFSLTYPYEFKIRKEK